MPETVVKSEDVAPAKVPTSFKHLNKPELVAAANFFGSDTEGTLEVLRASLAENGVTWEMYANQFLAPVEAPVEEVILSEPEVDIVVRPEVKVREEIITAPEELQLVGASKYLVKFIGDNLYFEFGRYRFSQEKPYATMEPDDAQKALVTEPDKFRQAFPKELQEYYS